LRVFDAAGQLIISNTPTNSYSAIVVAFVPGAGDYFVDVRSAGEPGAVGQYTLSMRPGPAIAPLQVESVVVNDGAAQRSVVRSLTVSFTELATFLSTPAAAFQVSGPNGNVAVSVDFSGSTSSQTIARLTFSGSGTSFGSLDDGDWTLTAFASQISDSLGQALDGDFNGYVGGNYVFQFHRLFGDLDADTDVDALDFLAFRDALGSSVGDANFQTAFDYDNDNDVDASDFLQFRTRFGTVLP